MSRLPDAARTLAEPGPECFCGAEIKPVILPDDLQALSGRTHIWVHSESGDTLCYPGEYDNATAEPVD